MQNKNLKIKVFGIGNGGQNSVDYLYLNNKSKNIDFVVINSDEAILKQAKTRNKYILSGEYYSDKGESLGCGGDPKVGKEYALKHINIIREIAGKPDVIFLIAGFGGGCGTGATPVIAEMLKEQGIKTIAIVTKPFAFESPSRLEIVTSETKISITPKFPDRMERATEGIKKLQPYVEKYIVVDNQSLVEIFQPGTTLAESWNYVNRKVAEEFYRAINNL